MKHLSATVLAASLTFSVFAYPSISSGPVELNVWNKNMAAAKAFALANNRPAMVAVVDTETCSYCTKWNTNILMLPAWPAFLAQNPMVLIWVDRATLTSAEWSANTAPYRTNGGISFPTIAILHPNGGIADKFLARDSLGKDPGFYNRVKNTTNLYPYNPPSPVPGVIGFEGAAFRTVSEGAGVCRLKVVRTGGSSGAQTFSYATSAGTAQASVHYTHRAGTLTWAAGDAGDRIIDVPLINDGQWKSPTSRTFTIALAKTSGTAGTGTLTCTVTIQEVSPLTRGMVGFVFAGGTVREGQAYTGSVARTAGTVGATTGTLSVAAGYVLDVSEFVWTDGQDGPKTFVVSVPAATPAYDPYTFNVALAVTGSAVAGLTNTTVAVRDDWVSQTLAEYAASQVGNPAYARLAQTRGVWFYNATEGALRGEPLTNGASAELSWTAPGPGRLTFTARDSSASLAPPLVGPPPVFGTFNVVVGSDTSAIGSAYATYSVLVNAGNKVSWIAQSQADGFYGMLKDLVWEPLNPVSGTGYSPASGRKFQIDHIRADNRLVDLVWRVAGVNPADTLYKLYAGGAPGSMRLVHTGTSAVGGVNAVAAGVVNTVAAQGAVYWRVDTALTGATARTAYQIGPVFNFAVIDLPLYVAPTPGGGAVVNAFLDAGAFIQIRAESATAVTYSATGLPSGMSINAGSGLISGEPQSAGNYPVVITARNSEGPVTVAFTIRVQQLPGQSAVGTFNGFFYQGAERVVRGTLKMSATAGGGLTVKAFLNGFNYSMRGGWTTGTPDGTFTAKLENRLAGECNIQVDAAGIMTGNFNGASLLGRRLNPTRTAEFIGYYTTLLEVAECQPNSPSINNVPQGDGYLTFSVNVRGSVKYSGALADGTKISGASELAVYSGAELAAMGYTGVAAGRSYACFPVYKTLYSRRGAVAGQVWIDGMYAAVPGDNRVSITGSSWIYPGRNAALTADGFAASFDDVAFTQIGAYYGVLQNLAPTYGGATFTVAQGSAVLQAVGLSVALPSGNALGARMTARNSTGLFSGSFRLVPQVAGGRAVTTRYAGAFVPALGTGGGYYLEADPSAAGYRLKRSRSVLIAR